MFEDHMDQNEGQRGFLWEDLRQNKMWLQSMEIITAASDMQMQTTYNRFARSYFIIWVSGLDQLELRKLATPIQNLHAFDLTYSSVTLCLATRTNRAVAESCPSTSCDTVLVAHAKQRTLP
ncbi:hypothetical protein FRX31_022836 [Thalictrum thalictroides]|uniref:Uncharacterized protein n=1 Tax=Thalictrum thalictroides TaxID=46969 RepID=A0A7J6VR73_THATH|nr:hypothetical protein FRX31_022836 [Thalictrum thalictroides]